MQRGFTLVELAIVLVIIGLIVGGVLVGQDLIKAAQIRAVASDIQKFSTGATAFQTKYAGIPGDLLSTAAINFGLAVSATTPGTFGEGDGDGVLENGGAGVGGSAVAKAGLGGENTLFWRQLTQAQMIPFGSTADGTTIDATSITGTSTEVTTLTPLVPQLRIRQSGFIFAFGVTGINYYGIAQWTLNGQSNGYIGGDVVLSAREAQGIDQKLDDGFPATGTVLSFKTFIDILVAPAHNGGNAGSGNAPSSSNTICYDSTTANGVYATSSEDIANGIRCALRIKAGF